MAEPFKNLLNANTVQAIGAALASAWPAFDRAAFDGQRSWSGGRGRDRNRRRGMHWLARHARFGSYGRLGQ